MITIIDYGISNIGSVANALNKLGFFFKISADPLVLRQSTVLILPGVGQAATGMRNLKNRGLDKEIIKQINQGKSFLGICLGMQLLFDFSQEGNVDCLGILKGEVKRFKLERKIPQIGWNQVKFVNKKNKKQFKEIPENSYFYFVNSYYCVPEDKSIVAGVSEYGETFASVVVKNNILATQFHPEKSGESGFQLIRNFINISPC